MKVFSVYYLHSRNLTQAFNISFILSVISILIMIVLSKNFEDLPKAIYYVLLIPFFIFGIIDIWLIYRYFASPITDNFDLTVYENYIITGNKKIEYSRIVQLSIILDAEIKYNGYFNNNFIQFNSISGKKLKLGLILTNYQERKTFEQMVVLLKKKIPNTKIKNRIK